MPQLSEALAERSMSDTPNGIVIGENHLDQDLMEDPQAWTSIAEQYAPYEDDLGIEVSIKIKFRRQTITKQINNTIIFLVNSKRILI